MIYSRTLITCLISLLIIACESQQPTTPIKKTTAIKPAPQQPTPALDLSIDNIPVEPQNNNDDIFIKEKTPTKENSDLFKTLSKDQAESSIKFSGKLFTDEEKIENKEYLESVEGVQINIEGEFD